MRSPSACRVGSADGVQTRTQFTYQKHLRAPEGRRHRPVGHELRQTHVASCSGWRRSMEAPALALTTCRRRPLMTHPFHALSSVFLCVWPRDFCSSPARDFRTQVAAEGTAMLLRYTSAFAHVPAKIFEDPRSLPGQPPTRFEDCGPRVGRVVRCAAPTPTSSSFSGSVWGKRWNFRSTTLRGTNT